MPRNSASRIVSWPSRARSKTISVTASLGSFAFARERDLREVLFLPERLDAALILLRLAIMAGIVLQLDKTASGFRRPVPEKSGPSAFGQRALQVTHECEGGL